MVDDCCRGGRIDPHRQQSLTLDGGRHGVTDFTEMCSVAVAAAKDRGRRPGGGDPALVEELPGEPDHLGDPLGVDGEPQVPDRGGEPQLRHIAHLHGDLLSAPFDEGAQLDQQAVLVAHLLGDAVAVRRETISERVAIRLQQRTDLVEWKLERAQPPDGDGGLRPAPGRRSGSRCPDRRSPARAARSRRSGAAFHREAGGVREPSDAQHGSECAPSLCGRVKRTTLRRRCPRSRSAACARPTEASRRCAGSTSRSRRARSSASSVRTAPARRRRSRSSRATAAATRGEVRVLGHDPERPGPDFRERIGVVLQSSELLAEPHRPRDARDVRRLLRDAARRATRSIALVGLDGEGGRARQDALGRPEAAARPRRRARRRSGARLPRRADDRLRPGGAARGVGDDPLAPLARQDRPPHDALPRRGASSSPTASPSSATACIVRIGTPRELTSVGPRGRDPLPPRTARTSSSRTTSRRACSTS